MPFIVFIFLIILSYITPLKYQSEFQFVEISQLIILFSCFILTFQHYKLFLRVSNFLTFILRELLFLFLFYEEVSILTASDNFAGFNYQSQLNLHNLNFFLENKIFSLNINNLHLSWSLLLIDFIYIISLFIISYGSYLPFLKRIRFFFLEKQFAIYTFAYLANLVFSSLFRDLNIISKYYILDEELIELFTYSILLFDVIQKNKILKKTKFKS